MNLIEKMNPQTKIYFRVKQINLKEGLTDNIKLEIRLNEDTLQISVTFF